MTNTELKREIIEAATTIADKRAQLYKAREELAEAETALEQLLDGLRSEKKTKAQPEPKDEPEEKSEPTAAVRKLRAEKPRPNAGIPAKDVQGRKHGPIAVKVLQALQASPRAMTALELQTAAGASMGGVYYALERLTALGRVKRASEAGFFEVVESPIARAS